MNSNDSKTSTCQISWCTERHAPEDDWGTRLSDGAEFRVHSLERGRVLATRDEAITDSGVDLAETHIYVDSMNNGSIDDARQLIVDLGAVLNMVGGDE